MVKIRYSGKHPYRHKPLTSGWFRISAKSTFEIEEKEAERLLKSGPHFQLADNKISKTESVPEPKTLSKPSTAVEEKVDEKEEAPKEQKPEKKEKVLKAKPKAKKPKSKKDKLRKKLQSKRSKK